MNYSDLKKIYKNKGYKFFEKGAYNLNIFGFRSNDLKVNEFNDIIGVAYIDDLGNEQCLTFKGTTKAGLYWLKNKKGNINGTFILKPNQYIGCFEKGLHNGSYDALHQKGYGIFEGYRDGDSDGELDYSGEIYNDVTGLNLHTTSWKSNTEKVNKYSAGCQVVKSTIDFLILMSIIDRALEKYSNSFSYTLFEFDDLK